MDKCYLYSEMMEFKRSIVSQEELLSMERYHTYRKFDTEDELLAYENDKGIKVSEGYYKSNNRVIKGRQGYASVFFYDKQEMLEHYEAKGGASGFTGKCYSDWIYFDLESQINPEDLKSKITRFMNYLVDKQIQYKLFYSGNKGLHLYIPMKYIQVSVEIETKANLICKAFSKQIVKQFPELADVIDPQVYAINTCLRMPFTINQKSGKLKTIMVWVNDTLTRMPNDLDTFNLIYNQMLNLDSTEIEHHWVLDESLLNQAMPTEIKFETYFPCPYGEKACIWKMFNTKLKKGDHRHDYAIRLMSFLKNDKEFPNTWVWSLMQRWNQDCLEEPMTEQELQSVFRGIETYNYNLCKDPMMNKFCTQNNQCQFWATKNSVQKGTTIMDAIRDAQEDAKDTSPRYNMNAIFEGMDVELRPNRGMIIGIIAGSKAGKSLIAINIAIRSKIPTVIFSYEMSKLTLLEQFSKMLNLNPLDPMDAKAFVEATKHIFIVDSGRCALQNWTQEVKNIERIHKVKISFVIPDYCQIVPVYDINKPGWFIENEVSRMTVMASLLPDMVKENHWVIFLPAQTTKGVEGGGSTILLPNSASGGKGYLNLCDGVITAWRPYKNEDPLNPSSNDNVISLWMGAWRHGREGNIMNYDYIGDRRLIGKPYNGVIKQKAPITD